MDSNIDFLSQIKTLGLLFCSAKDLQNWAEMLLTGSPWMCKHIETVYTTKNKIYLHYHDVVVCLQSLMHNPLLKDYIDFMPWCFYKSAEKLVWVYTEWLPGDVAWLMQVLCDSAYQIQSLLTYSLQEKLPPGATLLGTILSSDKTNISTMTGN